MIFKSTFYTISKMFRTVILAACTLLCSCSITVKHSARILEKDSTAAHISLPPDNTGNTGREEMTRMTDTVRTRGTNLTSDYIDSEGTIIIAEPLEEVVITASVKNVAERKGKVSISFDINIPERMLNTYWQIRLHPAAVLNGDTVMLDSVHITGKDYRERQIKGYELYRRFLSGIITDSSMLVHTELLELFISRNFPAIAALRTDSSLVAKDSIEGLYGISMKEAREHYRKRLAERINNRKKDIAGEKYRRYIKDPYITDGIRKDTIFDGTGEGMTYRYIQTIGTESGLGSIDIIMDGDIYYEGKEIYTMPEASPISFHITSFSTMTEDTERYLTEVIERKVMFNTSALINFRAGEYIIDENYCDNLSELEHIRAVMHDLDGNGDFVADSLIITASCSPEGSYRTNEFLAKRRAESVSGHMTGSRFRLSVKHIPENWERLEGLIMNDTCISDRQGILAIMKEISPDRRESILKRHKEYGYIRDRLYPALREVRFDFHLHRKDMVKDTIHTTVPDTVYRKGIQMLKDRHYKEAMAILGQYEDINSALAFLAMDYNASALRILQKLPESGKRDYLLAIAYSRCGNEKEAVCRFMSAVSLDRSFGFRGNLDPEISRLIDKYGLEPLKD